MNSHPEYTGFLTPEEKRANQEIIFIMHLKELEETITTFPQMEGLLTQEITYLKNKGNATPVHHLPLPEHAVAVAQLSNDIDNPYVNVYPLDITPPNTRTMATIRADELPNLTNNRVIIDELNSLTDENGELHLHLIFYSSRNNLKSIKMTVNQIDPNQMNFKQGYTQTTLMISNITLPFIPVYTMDTLPRPFQKLWTPTR